MKKFFAVLVASLLVLSGCNNIVTTESSGSSTSNVPRTVISGSSGEIKATDMTNGSMTISYTSGTQKNYARLYVSEGNGTGLILANADMSYSSGTYTYTTSHSTFTSGANIYVCVLVNDGGVESCVPQGTLSNTSSWASVTYGVETSDTSSAEIVSGGTYSIIAKCSGKSLDVDGWSTTAGTNIIQWTHGDNQANQKWILQATSDGYYTITSVHSGFCLDVDDWGTTDGVNVLQWNNYSQTNQQWYFEKLSDGYYKIVNRNSGKVLDVSAASPDDGANVQQWTWNESDAQRWLVTRLDSGTTGSSSGTTSGSTSGTTTTGNAYNPSDGVSLISLSSGKEMTFQFQNKTNTYSNDRIYVCCVARDSAGQFCYLTPSGELVRIVANQYSDAWSYKLSDINGFQVPETMTSGRLFISIDTPVVMHGIVDGAGNIGVVQPDLNNTADPNVGIYFDWIEFTVSGGGFWGNTTQVDQFCFPITMSMYEDSGYLKSVGITKSREEIFSSFETMAQTEFRSLVQRPYRIVAPCKGEFRTGRTYGTYMQSYVDEVWNYYATNKLYLDHPLGQFEGYTSGDTFVFYCTNGYGTAVTGEKYYITGKPNNDELFEGSGVLASPSAGADGAHTTVELALQAQMCAALNRHVVKTPSTWSTPSTYYSAAPANYYAKFWHDNSIDSKAYGFCYDDVADQSTLIETHSPRALVIGISW